MLMGQFIKENGGMDNQMAKVLFTLMMDLNIQEHGSMGSIMGTEYMNLKARQDMMECGMRGNTKEKDDSTGLIVLIIKEVGPSAKKMDSESSLAQMESSMRENGQMGSMKG